MNKQIERSWWGLDIMYSSGVSVAGGEHGINSDEECVEEAKRRILEDDTIKQIKVYCVDLPVNSSWGVTTVITTLGGKNVKRNSFDDPKFCKMYNELVREQD